MLWANALGQAPPEAGFESKEFIWQVILRNNGGEEQKGKSVKGVLWNMLPVGAAAPLSHWETLRDSREPAVLKVLSLDPQNQHH